MPEYLSIVEAQQEDDFSVPSLMAYAKRHPDKVPLWIKPAGDGWVAKLISRVLGSGPGEPEWWSYTDVDVWVTQAVRIRPETLVGGDGGVFFQRFRHDGRHPEYGDDVREYLEFPEPRQFGAMDLLVRRADLGRWKVLTAARNGASDHAERLREQIRVVAERADFSWTTVQAADAVGVPRNTLLDRRRRAERLDLPLVWRAMNPDRKRLTYRWVDDAEALRNWSALLDLRRGQTEATPTRRGRGADKRKGGAPREVGDEIARLLA